MWWRRRRLHQQRVEYLNQSERLQFFEEIIELPYSTRMRIAPPGVVDLAGAMAKIVTYFPGERLLTGTLVLDVIRLFVNYVWN